MIIVNVQTAIKLKMANAFMWVAPVLKAAAPPAAGHAAAMKVMNVTKVAREAVWVVVQAQSFLVPIQILSIFQF